MESCGECGFEYRPAAAPAAAAAITSGIADFAATLTGARDPRRRRTAQQWSPLEYGCHVRDVLLVQRERILLARRTTRPAVLTMGRDERADHDGYADQDPAAVARELTMSARLLANVLDRLTAEDWSRTVVYNYPEQTERDLRWVAVHTVHEVRHHLLDIRRQLMD
ncbi:DinB family protein [Nocardia spumae]|uniref:DinB family protein n=1 Tax=Nocardia spumae TaxID=2887190 RepID=UPI001D14E95E|nr:DinB family protein [Nocardia spumae]